MKHLKLLLMIISILVLGNATASSTDFALHQAVLDDDKQLVIKLISKGAAIDVIGSRKYGYGSALHLAVREGRLKIAKLLLDRGAQVDVLDPDDFTPLHNAAWNGNLEMTELLLDSGADINASTYDGDTPLSLAQNNDQAQVAEFIQAKLQAPSINETKIESTPVTDPGVIDISGTYTADITGSRGLLRTFLKRPRSESRREFKLVQNGNQVTGTFNDGRGKIYGEIKANSIRFRWENDSGSYGNGRWTVKPGTKELVGKFESLSGGMVFQSGKLNLTKIE